MTMTMINRGLGNRCNVVSSILLANDFILDKKEYTSVLIDLSLSLTYNLRLADKICLYRLFTRLLF